MGALLQLGSVLATLPDPVLVGAGGAVGAVARYGVGELLGRESFPVSVVLVNAVGSFLAALVAFAHATDEVVLLVGVGICGSLTTFATFSFETVALWERDRRAAAVAHAVGTLAVCLLAVALGWLLAPIA